MSVLWHQWITCWSRIEGFISKTTDKVNFVVYYRISVLIQVSILCNFLCEGFTFHFFYLYRGDRMRQALGYLQIMGKPKKLYSTHSTLCHAKGGSCLRLLSNGSHLVYLQKTFISILISYTIPHIHRKLHIYKFGVIPQANWFDKCFKNMPQKIKKKIIKCKKQQKKSLRYTMSSPWLTCHHLWTAF